MTYYGGKEPRRHTGRSAEYDAAIFMEDIPESATLPLR
jgi:hypothetical protein